MCSRACLAYLYASKGWDYGDTLKVIALCVNLPMEGWQTKEFGKRFPGSGWMRHLPELSRCKDTIILTGEEALNYPSTRDMYIVQEENNELGHILYMRGAQPQVNFCLESPIYASQYYDNIPKHFKHTLLFDGGTEHIYFPSFDDEDITEPVPWNERKHLCMVMANKHYRALPESRTDYTGPRSPSFLKAIKTQLHDYRYAAINHFMENDNFDLYGKGWPTDVPECTDKLTTIRNYKFALCFENGSYPGYITEKIIDCFVAGVIPFYMGAPDIERYIPEKLYLDAREFQSFTHMDQWVKDDIEDGYEPYLLKQATDWLHSPDGQKYNNKVFAKRILELCQ